MNVKLIFVLIVTIAVVCRNPQDRKCHIYNNNVVCRGISFIPKQLPKHMVNLDLRLSYFTSQSDLSDLVVYKYLQTVMYVTK